MTTNIGAGMELQSSPLPSSAAQILPAATARLPVPDRSCADRGDPQQPRLAPALTHSGRAPSSEAPSCSRCFSIGLRNFRQSDRRGKGGRRAAFKNRFAGSAFGEGCAASLPWRLRAGGRVRRHRAGGTERLRPLDAAPSSRTSSSITASETASSRMLSSGRI